MVIKSDLSNISKEFADILPDKVEVLETKDKNFVIGSEGVLVFEVGGKYFPTVKGALKIKSDKRAVTVDAGGPNDCPVLPPQTSPARP